jgi:peptidoglycan/xylan/chitin deacetylase (PgdA/CDA1 family)
MTWQATWPDEKPIQWIPILGYHRLVEATPADDSWHICTRRERFQRQMEWFARLGWRTLSLEEAGARLMRGERIPPRHFVITFDDGYLDTLTVGIPILRDLGFTATVFVVSGLVGERNEWDKGIGHVAPLMTWTQLEQVLGLGFSIGSHTVTHPHLDRLPSDVARRELLESRQVLERRLGVPIRTFCYPYGHWNEQVRALVAHAGYDVACDETGRSAHGRYTLARTNPGYWPPALTPLVRSQSWYYTLNRSGVLGLPRRLKQALRPARRGLRETTEGTEDHGGHGE